MNGPQHYRAAEDLLVAANELRRNGSTENALAVAATAQVHATLALAAATITPQVITNGQTGRDWMDLVA